MVPVLICISYNILQIFFYYRDTFEDSSIILTTFREWEVNLPNLGENWGKSTLAGIGLVEYFSVLPTVSKIFERIIQKQISCHINDFLLPFSYWCRKGVRSQYVLLPFIEKYKMSLDNKKNFSGRWIRTNIETF